MSPLAIRCVFSCLLTTLILTSVVTSQEQAEVKNTVRTAAATATVQQQQQQQQQQRVPAEGVPVAATTRDASDKVPTAATAAGGTQRGTEKPLSEASKESPKQTAEQTKTQPQQQQQQQEARKEVDEVKLSPPTPSQGAAATAGKTDTTVQLENKQLHKQLETPTVEEAVTETKIPVATKVPSADNKIISSIKPQQQQQPPPQQQRLRDDAKTTEPVGQAPQNDVKPQQTEKQSEKQPSTAGKGDQLNNKDDVKGSTVKPGKENVEERGKIETKGEAGKSSVQPVSSPPIKTTEDETGKDSVAGKTKTDAEESCQRPENPQELEQEPEQRGDAGAETATNEKAEEGSSNVVEAAGYFGKFIELLSGLKAQYIDPYIVGVRNYTNTSDIDRRRSIGNDL